MELKVVRYEVADRVATVTLNRPERLNAWTGRMEHELRVVMGRAGADDDVRAIVLTGAGRGFCAGGDSTALEGHVERGAYDSGVPDDAPIPVFDDGRPDFGHALSYLLGIPKPVIAAVNGPAAGVGFALMCFTDVRFAVAGAKLTTSFARLGLPAEHGVSWLLTRLVGVPRAADLLLSSRVVLAEEALAMGLVNRVLPPEELLPAALDYARAIATGSAPSSVRTIKRQLYADLFRDLDASARESVELLHQMVGSADFDEGVAALREKRAPKF